MSSFLFGRRSNIQSESWFRSVPRLSLSARAYVKTQNTWRVRFISCSWVIWGRNAFLLQSIHARVHLEPDQEYFTQTVSDRVFCPAPDCDCCVLTCLKNYTRGGNAYVKACLKSWGITRMILVGSSQWWTEGGMHSFAQVYAPFYERLHLAQRRVHHGGCLPWRRKNPSPSFPNLNHNGLSETVMNVYIGFRKNVTYTERNFGVLLNF